MNKNKNLEMESEAKVIAFLTRKPSFAFDLDGNAINISMFSDENLKVIYMSILSIAEDDKSLLTNRGIDKVILLNRISDKFTDSWLRNEKVIRSMVERIFSFVITKEECMKFVGIMIRNHIKREALETLNSLVYDIKTIDNAKEIISKVEQEVFEFTNRPISGRDIEVLGDRYDNFLAERERRAREGTLTIGIESPFKHYNEAIGGGFRPGTISILAARSKMGKSWVAAKIADYVSRKNIPVLYLDTELENNYQSDRRMAQCSRIPIRTLETAKYMTSKEQLETINKTKNEFRKYPIYYVDIKGWSLERQVSVIRRFFAKHVGRRKNGEYNDALVILDYLKLMRAGEKGADKEWEALGYRMTLLHDLMGSYKQPMLALAQQNRSGLDKEDESTVSGSDRIIYLCDNFSIFSRLSDADIELQNQEAEEGVNWDNDDEPIKVPNTRLKVVVCRHGSGTKNGYISMYADIHDPRLGTKDVCGYVEEGPVRTDRVEIKRCKVVIKK